MSDYLISEDGKIHTRYTELVRCTVGQVERVVAERLGKIERFKSERLEFGSDRHAMWEAESKATGKLPECFGLDWEVSHVEHEFATELLPGVIVHSRPDTVCSSMQTIVDYKTLCADSLDSGVRKAAQTYSSSKQLPFYAFQVGIHGIRIKRIAYLIEIWNVEQDTILGYHSIVRELRMAEMAKVLPWVHDRISVLAAALEGVAV